MTTGQRLGAGYWRLVGASTTANLGDGIAGVALPWYASLLTDSPALIAAVGVANRLPWLLLTLLAGVVGDRVDRRLLLIGAGGSKTVVVGALAALVALDVGGIGVVVAVAFGVGVCEVFFDNTAQTLIPSLVRRDQLERANGTLWGAELVTQQFLGPPLGGVLIAVSVGTPFTVQAVLLALAVLLLLGIRGRFRPTTPTMDGTAAATAATLPTPTPTAMLTEGLRWLWRHRMLRTLAVVLGVANLCGALTTATLVLFAQETLGLTATGFGVLLTATAVGGVLGSQIGPWLSARIRTSTVIGGFLVAETLGTAVIAVRPSVPVFAVVSVALGFGAVWWNVATVSLRQRLIPDHLLGRVNSAYRTLAWGMIPVGAGLGGALVTVVEPWLGRDLALRSPYVLAAVLTGALVVVALRRLDAATLAAAEAAGSTSTSDVVQAGRMARRRVRVHGRVQGVGFRAATRRQAELLGVDATAENLPDGSVEVVASGSPDRLEELLDWLRHGPPAADVTRVEDGGDDHEPGTQPEA